MCVQKWGLDRTLVCIRTQSHPRSRGSHALHQLAHSIVFLFFVCLHSSPVAMSSAQRVCRSMSVLKKIHKKILRARSFSDCDAERVSNSSLPLHLMQSRGCNRQKHRRSDNQHNSFLFLFFSLAMIAMIPADRMDCAHVRRLYGRMRCCHHRNTRRRGCRHRHTNLGKSMHLRHDMLLQSCSCFTFSNVFLLAVSCACVFDVFLIHNLLVLKCCC